MGEKRYNELYKKVQGQKIDYKTIKSQYTADEINVIRTIEEIIYEEGQNWCGKWYVYRYDLWKFCMIYGSFYIDSFIYSLIYLLPIKFSAYVLCVFYLLFLSFLLNASKINHT